MSSNIIDFVRAGADSDRKDINKILAELQDLSTQDPEDAALQERIVLWDSRRKKISTLNFAGVVDRFEEHTRDRRTEPITMEMPTTCQTSPFTQTTNGALVFDASSGATKFGGGGAFDGSADSLELDHIAGSDLDLERTDAFSIATFFKRANALPQNSFLYKRNGVADTFVGYSLGISALGSVFWDICDGTVLINAQSSFDNDDDLWHSAVATYDGLSLNTGMNLYIDGVLDQSLNAGTLTSTIKNSLITRIGSESDGGSKLTGSLAWTMILKEEMTSTWASEFNAGHFDFSGGNLIFFIPFTGEDTILGEANTPYCVSS